MAPEERTEIVQVLEDSRKVFNDAAGGLSEAQAGTSPAEGRWSVLQCVEHVTTVEERFLGFLKAAPKTDTPRVDKEKEAGLLVRIPDRTTRINAPEAVLPTGRFTTLAEALEQFHTGSTRSIQFAQDRSGDLYYLASEHARLGPMNGAEFLILIAAHARRHAAQIREVRAALGKN